MTSFNIDANKSIYVRVEDGFAEEYNPLNPVQQIKFENDGFKYESVTELLEIVYMNDERKLDADISAGRITGKLDASKNLDKSCLATAVNKALIEAGLGELEEKSNTTTISSVSTVSGVTTLTVASGSGFASGDFIQVVKSGNKTSIYKIKTVSLDDFVLEYPVTDDDLLVMVATADVNNQTKCKVARPKDTVTFQFIIVDNDGKVEVMKGASLAIKEDHPVDKQGKHMYNIMSASVAYKDANKVRYTKPTNITLEGQYNPIKFNFQVAVVKDPATGLYVTAMPVLNEINVEHTVNPGTHVGGVNNITGWYTEPSIKGELMFDNNAINLELFGPDASALTDNAFFLSQKDYAFEADGVKFVTKDRGAINDKYSTISVVANVNHRTDKEPVIILPQ